MKISAFNNGQVQSKQANFQARPLKIDRLLTGSSTIKPEDLGKAHMDFDTFRGAKMYVVGILRKGLNGYNSLGDFITCAQEKNPAKARTRYQKLNTAVDKALTTDGEPIHLDINYNIRP